MPRPRKERDETQTTLRISTELHYWLRQYALSQRTTLTGVLENVLTDWASEHGYKPTDSPDKTTDESDNEESKN